MNAPPARLFVTAKAAIWSEDRLLLLREDPGDGAHVHDLPGGRLEPGEQILDALRRELHEELGVRVKSISPLPIKVWSTTTRAGVGVVALLHAVELSSLEFDHSGAEEVVGAEFLTLEEYLRTREFIHKQFIVEHYRERSARPGPG